jgi:glycoside/pentoside/hexuronide:cation symporter, GPH family
MIKAMLALPIGMAGLPVYMLAPQFYHAFGLSLTTTGVLLMVMRLIDVFLDPVIGRAIDRGRNLMPLALVGAPLGMVVLFIAPYFTQNLAVTLCLGSLMVSLSLSVMSISLYASHHGHSEREKLTQWREGLLVAGVVLGAFLPPVFMQSFGDRVGILSFVIIFIVTLFVSYRPFSFEKNAHDVSYKGVFQNKPLMRVLALVLINGIPTAITSVLFFYFTQHVMQTKLAPLFILLFFASAVLSMGFWLKLAKRFRELNVLVITIGLSPLVFLMAYLVQAGDLVLFAVICVSSGVLFGGDAVLLPLLVSKTLGEAKGGLVFGLNAFLTKLTNALAVGLVFPFIVALGFSLSAIDNAAPVRMGYVILPVAFKLLSLAFILYLKRISK